jgi:hypothetical protein
MQTNSVSRDVIAHHEAGHGVAGLVLGVPFTEVRIVPGEDGKIGVPLKTNPWTGPRPASNPGEFTDEEWAELSRSDEEWQAWKKRDNDGAGKDEMSLLRKLRLLLVMLFLQGIAVNAPAPVSQLLAPERHEIELIGHRVLKYESKSIFGNRNVGHYAFALVVEASDELWRRFLVTM